MEALEFINDCLRHELNERRDPLTLVKHNYFLQNAKKITEGKHNSRINLRDFCERNFNELLNDGLIKEKDGITCLSFSTKNDNFQYFKSYIEDRFLEPKNNLEEEKKEQPKEEVRKFDFKSFKFNQCKFGFNPA